MVNIVSQDLFVVNSKNYPWLGKFAGVDFFVDQKFTLAGD